MPEETYKLNYVADASAFVSASHQVEAALLAVDKAAEKTKADLKGFAGGAGRSASAAARQVNGLNDALGGTPAKAQAAKASLDGIHVSATKAGQGMGNFILASAGLSAAHQALTQILQITSEIEKHWKDLAAESVAFREGLRELANIKGANGPNNQVMAGVLDMALQANMVPQAAKDFTQSYENIGPAIRDARHFKPTQGTADQLEKDIMVEAARTSQRMGIDPSAAAEALGSAGLNHTFTGKEQAMTIYGGALRGLSEGKVSYTAGVKSLNKASAKLVDTKEAAGDNAKPGRIGSFDEAGVYLGAMSLGTGTADQAAHRMVQNSRVLNPASETGQAALQEAGITDADNDAQRLIKLNDHTRNIPDRIKWLRDHELGTDATREGMEASFKAADTLKLRLGRMVEGRKGDATGRQFIADNQRNIAADRTAAPRQAAVVKGILDQTEGEQVEPLETAKQLAEQRLRLRDPGYATSTWRSFRNRVLSIGTGIEKGVTGTDDEQEGYLNDDAPSFAAIPTLRRGGDKVGINVKRQFPGLGSVDYRKRAKAFKEAAEAVQAKGGDPYGRDEIESKTRGEIEKMGGPAPGQAAGQPGAAGVGGQRVQVESSDLKAAGKDFKESIQIFTAAVRSMQNGRGGSPSGDGLGGGYVPYRT